MKNPIYKAWFLAYGATDYATNALEFDTVTAATEYAQDLFLRWTGAEEWQVRDQDGNVMTGSKPEDKPAMTGGIQ